MFKKRIPTILGLLLLLCGAVVGVVFVSQQTDFLPRAAPDLQPQKVKFTNLSENSFVVSWVTQSATAGYIKLGTNPNQLDTTVTDERDQLSGSSGDYRTHYIPVQGLEPATIYYFKIYSDKQAYDCEGKTCSVTTAPIGVTPPPADTAYGSVVTAAQTPAEGSMVYITMADATPMSALVKKDGNWAVSISTARTLDIQKYATYDSQATRLDILVQPGTGEPGRATTTTGNTKPVPTITLGQTVDFSNQTKPAIPGSVAEAQVVKEAAETAASASATPVPESQFSLEDVTTTESSTAAKVAIKTIDDTPVTTVTPKVESTQPTIAGTAPKGTKITITMHSEKQYTGTITVGGSGEWEWTPPDDLEPGSHTVTITYNDVAGKPQTVTKTFVVAGATAAAPGYSASPSATPKATPVSTDSGRVSYPSTASGVPTSGAITPTLTFLFFGLTLIAGGWFLLYRQQA